MSKGDENIAWIATKTGIGIGGIAFGLWTLYRAVPMLWGWSIESLGGPPITGMQALALGSLVTALRPGPVISDTDSEGRKHNPYIVVWTMPLGVWLSVGLLHFVSWLIGVPL